MNKVVYILVAFVILISALQIGSFLSVLGLFSETSRNAVLQVQTSAEGEVSNEASEESFVPESIEIPAVGINLPIVSVPLESGTWAVHENVANYAEGTSLVSRSSGNVGLFGHDTTQVFHKIKDLHSGAMIVVQNEKFKAIYQVTESAAVAPTSVEVFLPKENSALTLITCDGLFSRQRYMVRAELLEFTNKYEQSN